MALGLPILAKPNSGLPEVLGDAVLWIDPSDMRSMMKTVRSVVEDDTLREDLINKGYKQAERYRWSHVVERVVESFKSVTTH
jgi:glycosyltransferase involved in cell wall biosynthesis